MFAGIIRQACVLTTDLQTNIAARFSSDVDYSFKMTTVGQRFSVALLSRTK